MHCTKQWWEVTTYTNNEKHKNNSSTKVTATSYCHSMTHIHQSSRETTHREILPLTLATSPLAGKLWRCLAFKPNDRGTNVTFSSRPEPSSVWVGAHFRFRPTMQDASNNSMDITSSTIILSETMQQREQQGLRLPLHMQQREQQGLRLPLHMSVYAWWLTTNLQWLYFWISTPALVTRSKLVKSRLWSVPTLTVNWVLTCSEWE